MSMVPCTGTVFYATLGFSFRLCRSDTSCQSIRSKKEAGRESTSEHLQNVQYGLNEINFWGFNQGKSYATVRKSALVGGQTTSSAKGKALGESITVQATLTILAPSAPCANQLLRRSAGEAPSSQAKNVDHKRAHRAVSPPSTWLFAGPAGEGGRFSNRPVAARNWKVPLPADMDVCATSKPPRWNVWRPALRLEVFRSAQEFV